MTNRHDGAIRPRQRVVVFQQNGSGERKIAGVRQYGADLIAVSVVSIDGPLPAVIDDTDSYLPRRIEADLVLDFLTHYDLSTDLVKQCARDQIPVISSGKKSLPRWALIPPT